MLDCLSFADLQVNGRISSLLCLCGISVSVVVYLLYSKFFYPRSYYSAILTKLVRRLLLRRTRERLASSLRTKRSVVPSNSTSGEQPNDDDVSKTTESPCASVRASSISSSHIAANDDNNIIRVPSDSQLKCLSSLGPPPSGRRLRHRRRRRTHSESLDVPRLDDFICLIPELVRPPKYGHGTRNVIDWLAQIAIEVDPEDRFPGGGLQDREQDGEGCDGDGVEKAVLVRSVGHRRGVDGGGTPSEGCLGELDTAGIEAIVKTLFGTEDVKKRLEINGASRDDDEEEEGEGVESRRQGLRKSGGILRTQIPERSNWIDGRTEVEENEDETADLFDVSEDTNTPSKVFYFEDEDDDDDDFTPGAHSASPLHPGTRPYFTLQQQQQQRRQHQQQQQQQQHDTLTPLNRLGMQPDDPTHPTGTGYEWLRARLHGPSRNRCTSTGSRASLELLAAAAAQGLTRNHFSFNSELSAASSDYTYRESLLSKGLSVDGGEDLDRLVIPGDDLLYAADLSRWTLTNIDQLHEELENIQRDISDINSKVEVLQSREDLTDFTSRYDISGVNPEEERRNSIDYHSNTDLRMRSSSSTMPSQRRRSRSVSFLPPQTAFDPEEGFRACEPDDLNLHSAQGDGFAWDYDDPGLAPTLTQMTPTHFALRRASNTFRLDEEQRVEVLKSSQERQFVFHNDEDDEDDDEEEEDRADWDEQLSQASLSDCDDGPDYTAAEHPVAEYSNATDDEYIDDGYEVLTRFQR